MSFSLTPHCAGPNPDLTLDTFPALLQLPRPLLDYRIVMAIIKGDVGAVNIIKDALKASEELCVDQILLMLGPTTPHSLQIPHGSRILWATFTDRVHLQNGSRLTVVPPNLLTDLSLNLDKLSRRRGGRIPLLIGDFLDNVLSVSTVSAGLYAFLCKLFTRIRTNQQTAFFLATEDMHDSKKTAVLRRFADVVIEYRSTEENSNHRVEARILDHVQNYYDIWDSSENPDSEYEREFLANKICQSGRQPGLLVKESVIIPP